MKGLLQTSFYLTSLILGLTACGPAKDEGAGDLNVGQGQDLAEGTWADALGAIIIKNKPCTVVKVGAYTLLTADSCVTGVDRDDKVKIIVAKEFVGDEPSANGQISTVVTEIRRFGTYKKAGEKVSGADIAILRIKDNLSSMGDSLGLDYKEVEEKKSLVTVGYGCAAVESAVNTERHVYRLRKGAFTSLAKASNKNFSDDFIQTKSRTSKICAADAGGPLLSYDKGVKPKIVGINAGAASTAMTGGTDVGIHTRIDEATGKNKDGLSVAAWLKKNLK